MTDRPLITVVGVLAVAWGLAVAFAPDLAGTIPTSYVFVDLLGLLAVIQGLRVVQQRRRSTVSGAETPDPETGVALPTPGVEFDDRVRTVHVGRRAERFRARKEIRRELERTLVEAVVDREGCSADDAREKLETGEWTDDPYAAAFLGGPSPPRRSWRDWLRRSLGGESRFQRRTRRTTDAVIRYMEADR